MIYLLTKRKHRDDVVLENYATNPIQLVALLIKELETFGIELIKVLDILEDESGGWIHYEYKQYEDVYDSDKYGFWKIESI
jgi:hypothetical protein